ncbi:efflux RND transporter periplasmic adaptor subunit [Planctobacterium marinum]|uniref:efflux RND transporter periplasmic adaptor subunit n=1 Tax=Planctobacterium marinum TaxID=1631968 RepID=UPI001E5538A7|nr:HlyD family efflux transporter periplasmic adaptor subunit [Planctobacterium marinum]MCC2604641.1 HlyD family efflux transporter periplasmic adaptor subunit [Planctobacterium marinum]
MIRDTGAQDVVMATPRKGKIKWIVAAAVLVIGAVSANALINSSDASLSIERATVQIATVEKGELMRDIVATGRVVAANAPQLYSPEKGFVNLQVKAGEDVKTGQVVATVDSPELDNQLKQERSELARLEGELARKELDTRRQSLTISKQADLAKLDLVAAERENRRAQISIKDHLINQIDLEKAKDELARAQVTFKHAEQEVALAKDTLAFELESVRNTIERQKLVVSELERQVEALTIKATVNGMVGSLFVQDRTLVAANDSLMTLVDLSAYEAEINVPESYANDLGLGMDVELKLANKTVTGTLSAISPEVTNREVTARVKFSHDNNMGIRQNQQLSARVLLEQKQDVLKVRRGSFTQSGGFVAYRLEGDIARRIDIQPGATSMREVEILSGVQPGDQLIISNYEEFAQANSILLR